MLDESSATVIASSHTEDVEDNLDPDAEDTTASHIIVYEGFLTQLITGRLNLSVPYYTSVRKSLIRMGCVRQLRRGGGNSPSQWEMIYEPTLEAFLKAQDPKVTKPSKEGAHNEQILSLSNRIGELEDWQESINEFLIKQFGTEPASE